MSLIEPLLPTGRPVAGATDHSPGGADDVTLRQRAVHTESAPQAAMTDEATLDIVATRRAPPPPAALTDELLGDDVRGDHDGAPASVPCARPLATTVELDELGATCGHRRNVMRVHSTGVETPDHAGYDDDVAAWRAGCECGWRSRRVYWRTAWPSACGITPEALQIAALDPEWHTHLRQELTPSAP